MYTLTNWAMSTCGLVSTSLTVLARTVSHRHDAFLYKVIDTTRQAHVEQHDEQSRR